MQQPRLSGAAPTHVAGSSLHTFRMMSAGSGMRSSASQASDQARLCRMLLAHFAGPALAPAALAAAAPRLRFCAAALPVAWPAALMSAPHQGSGCVPSAPSPKHHAPGMCARTSYTDRARSGPLTCTWAGCKRSSAFPGHWQVVKSQGRVRHAGLISGARMAADRSDRGGWHCCCIEVHDAPPPVAQMCWHGCPKPRAPAAGPSPAHYRPPPQQRQARRRRQRPDWQPLQGTAACKTCMTAAKAVGHCLTAKGPVLRDTGAMYGVAHNRCQGEFHAHRTSA